MTIYAGIILAYMIFEIYSYLGFLRTAAILFCVPFLGTLILKMGIWFVLPCAFIAWLTRNK